MQYHKKDSNKSWAVLGCYAHRFNRVTRFSQKTENFAILYTEGSDARPFRQGAAFLLPGLQRIEGGDAYHSENHGKTVGKGQKARPQEMLQLHRRQMPFTE